MKRCSQSFKDMYLLGCGQLFLAFSEEARSLLGAAVNQSSDRGRNFPIDFDYCVTPV